MFEFFPEEMPPKTCMQMTIKAQTFNNFVITFYISFASLIVKKEEIRIYIYRLPLLIVSWWRWCSNNLPCHKPSNWVQQQN